MPNQPESGGKRAGKAGMHMSWATFDGETHNKLKKLSAKSGKPISEIIRDAVGSRLKGGGTE